jgi:hypothetical protein
VGVHRELHNKYIAARNGNPPCSTKAFVWTVRPIEHHDNVRSGIFTYDFADKDPREWTKRALFTLVEATEAYMVEVTAEFHC